jgi:N-acyl-D-amino-acid deacylase
MGPLNEEMKQKETERQGDIKYAVDWTTLGEYLEGLEKRGVAMNVASFVGATTARIHELGEGDVQPSDAQLTRMRGLVREAMEQGAMGLGTSLIYAPASYAKTGEIIAMAEEAGRCGGIYISHMRSEGNRIEEALHELLEISRSAQLPAEIYHLKIGGRPNWPKLPWVLGEIEKARAEGLRITANMYNYEAGATGLDAAMPTWVQAGGLEAWIARLKDPTIRKRVIAEMRSPNTEWENLMRLAGPEGTLFLNFKSEKLKPLIGKRLSEVAAMRKKSAQDTAIDLVIEDGSRVEVAYFLMSEENMGKQLALPFVSFGSDAAAQAPEGVFLKSSTHPRAYGNFARLLGKYVREEKRMALAEAVRRLTSLSASNLSLAERGMLKAGYFADVVVFDPATIADHATFERPQVFATGVSDVVVNGVEALRGGEPTGALPGRVVRGRAWTGAQGGGCRANSSDWSWAAN